MPYEYDSFIDRHGLPDGLLRAGQLWRSRGISVLLVVDVWRVTSGNDQCSSIGYDARVIQYWTDDQLDVVKANPWVSYWSSNGWSLAT